MRKIIVLLICLLLTACSNTTSYVNSIFDNVLKNDSKSYCKLTKATKDEALVLHDAYIDEEVDYFLSVYALDDISDNVKSILHDTFEKIYLKAKYEIHDDNGIRVIVYPMDIMLDHDTYKALFKDMVNKIDKSDDNFDYYAYLDEIALAYNDLLLSKIDDIAYLDSEEYTLDVDEDKLYSIDIDQFNEIIDAIIVY